MDKNESLVFNVKWLMVNIDLIYITISHMRELLSIHNAAIVQTINTGSRRCICESQMYVLIALFYALIVIKWQCFIYVLFNKLKA